MDRGHSTGMNIAVIEVISSMSVPESLHGEGERLGVGLALLVEVGPGDVAVEAPLRLRVVEG